MKRINDDEAKYRVNVVYKTGESVCSSLPEIKTKNEAIIYIKTRAMFEPNVEYIELYFFDKNGIKKNIKTIHSLHDSCKTNVLKNNNMKRIKDSTIPDKWFMNGKAPLLNEPDSQNDTLWKVVLWSGSGYAADPYLFYAPKDFSEWQFEVLVAALEKNGITDYFKDDYYWNNPDIDTSEDAEIDVYDLMDENGDIDVDASSEGGGIHVLRGENLKIEPADEPIEYYMGETISDSRRVKDDEDDEFEFVVAVVGSESMSLEEGEQYEDELVKLLSYKRFSDGDRYCELNEVEIMDRDSSGDTSVAVWGDCFADSDSTVRKALKQWTANLGYDVRISTSGAIY